VRVKVFEPEKWEARKELMTSEQSQTAQVALPRLNFLRREGGSRAAAVTANQAKIRHHQMGRWPRESFTGHNENAAGRTCLNGQVEARLDDRRTIQRTQSWRPRLLGSHDNRSWYGDRNDLERKSPLVGTTITRVSFGTTIWRRLSGCRQRQFEPLGQANGRPRMVKSIDLGNGLKLM